MRSVAHQSAKPPASLLHQAPTCTPFTVSNPTTPQLHPVPQVHERRARGRGRAADRGGQDRRPHRPRVQRICTRQGVMGRACHVLSTRLRLQPAEWGWRCFPAIQCLRESCQSCHHSCLFNAPQDTKDMVLVSLLLHAARPVWIFILFNHYSMLKCYLLNHHRTRRTWSWCRARPWWASSWTQRSPRHSGKQVLFNVENSS